MFDEFNILKLFFEEPNREFNVREIARILKISPPTISSKLKSFVKLRILKYRKKRILDLYKSDLDSEDYLDLKRFYLLRQLKEIGLIDYLNHFYLKPTIVLFGSCADGLDTELSDIDLVIISENSKIADLKKFEKKLKRKIQLVIAKDVKSLKNEHLINNVINGLVLQGAIKWI